MNFALLAILAFIFLLTLTIVLISNRSNERFYEDKPGFFERVSKAVFGTSAKKTTTAKPVAKQPAKQAAKQVAKQAAKPASANVIKGGNNGTVSCNTFCTGDWSGGKKGYCVKATDVNSKKNIGCNDVPGFGHNLRCECEPKLRPAPARPKPQPVCDDIAPNQYTCKQQKDWGKCGEPWMAGFCKRTCGKCSGGGPAPQPKPKNDDSSWEKASITFFNAGDYYVGDPATSCAYTYSSEGERNTGGAVKVKNTFHNWDSQYTMGAISENRYEKAGSGFYKGGACGKCYEVELDSGTNAHEWGDYGRKKRFKVKVGDVCPGYDPTTGYNNAICEIPPGKQNSQGATIHFDLERSTLPSDFPGKDSMNLRPTGIGIGKAKSIPC